MRRRIISPSIRPNIRHRQVDVRYQAVPQAVRTPAYGPVAMRPQSVRQQGVWRNRILLGVALGGALLMATIVAIILGIVFLLNTNRILPAVHVLGISVGNMNVGEATQTLTDNFSTVTVRNGEHTWNIPAADLGIYLDAQATAEQALHYGRGEGNILSALVGSVESNPIVNIDPQQAYQGLQAVAALADVPAQNATIQLRNGELVPIPAQYGASVDVDASVNLLVSEQGNAFHQGGFDLVVYDVVPTVTDATPLLEKTRALLTAPLTINAFNPISNVSTPLTVPVEVWSTWLTTRNTDNGIALAIDAPALGQFLDQHQDALPSNTYLDAAETASLVQTALDQGNPTSYARAYNRTTTYTVQSGDTLGSIAWQHGIPYWQISQANPSLNTDSLSAGQTLTIPSPDVMLPHPIVYNKRIVISISRQRMWVYEDGSVKWEWDASTGIASSPTMAGVYQIISHDGQAYASVWNLHMPSFMSIYEAVPGFYNGIHGFPWRNGYQILWENALGTRVTYGCILLSSTNAALLYDWAEDGVVVEIQG